MMLIISTALFAWHHDSRKEANNVETQLNEARMAMSRASVSINSEWANLVTPSAKPRETKTGEGKTLWYRDLILVEETCKSLNVALELAQDSQLHLSVTPLTIWSEEADQWKRKNNFLRETVSQQYKTIDAL